MKIFEKTQLFFASAYFLPLLLFLAATGYMTLFTVGVPFFWDDHQFHEHFLSYTSSHWIKDILTNNIFSFKLYDARGVYALFISFLFTLFDYNFAFYRIAKAIVFGLYIVSLYFLAKLLFKDKKTAFILTLLPIFSFPAYIHTLVFDEPLIITEFFKVIGFICFLWSYKYSQGPKKISFLLLFFLFSFLATRTYITGYALYGAILFYLISDNLSFFRTHKWATFCIFILGIFGAAAVVKILVKASPHGNSIFPFTHTFFPDWSTVASTPFITFDALYYKPFSAMVSFFGIWLLIFSLLFIVFYVFTKHRFPHVFKEHQHDACIDYKLPAFFLIAWLISELPLWFSLPEHAIRYTTAIIPAITFLLGLLVLKASMLFTIPYKKYYTFLIVIALFGISMTNILYATAYRVGWGSSFIAMDNAGYTLLNYAPENSTALYFAQSAADDYILLTLEPGNYTIQREITFVKTSDALAFEPQALHELQKNYENVYVLQRASPQGTLYPPSSLEDREDLQHITTVSGLGDDPFDLLYSQLALFGRNAETSSVVIYKYAP